MSGINRQVYYRKINSFNKKRGIADQVVDLVIQERRVQPKLGTRKLYFILKNKLRDFKVGRDKFFDILRANHLLIIPKRSYHVTTHSYHRFRKHPNLIKEMEISEPEKVWVSDITYIGKREKPCYLSLITDVYSKKIVGFEVSDSLSTEGTLRALKMAQKNRIYNNKSLIHHSDRGLQYCSDEYQFLLKKYDIQCSMTQNSDPYENAIAERVNGILKQEFSIDTMHLDLPVMRRVVTEVIYIYNNQRPHLSNYMLTPNQMHLQQNIRYKTYKQKNSSKILHTTV
ncbi:IS3 family transposase [Elizabethkingia anophelis]|uniref:IS3 family transposase n=3 Tax=Elizabethkingia TaxID=308865 RepID=UPI001EE7389F|nr:IS3 family transposase [Elizabethkingia anophelis]UKY82112.1 IS3 family transposase [Elizabethkingia anophelis]UKY82677.1 IS3 family transposase [Elizabethkingia anophelis]UKY83228.1 IS3 family transposase [Elizabethkingia anophelis]UKY92747.1 IS3 family transposase [Elizabethkingia anophelis]UKY93311.1 IS3 family transposase [Elizabethkingia anophelis]